jgi:glycosyltransferase involved in cell wall biosynthesis
MLKRCIESVKAQACDDYIHILIRDDRSPRGYGKHNANRSFASVREIPAKYVMVLDDDDMLMDHLFVQDFRMVIADDPEIVFFRGVVHALGILPRPGYWEKPPVYGQIASFCSAVRHEVWMKHIRTFGRKELGGDHCFIRTCYDNTKDHFWWDRVVARTQKGPGRSKGERDHA